MAGLCASLFNLGLFHWQNDEPAEAFGAWVTAYRQARSMGLSQVLDTLEKLADQPGLPGGLDAWETLAQRMDQAAAGDGPALTVEL